MTKLPIPFDQDKVSDLGDNVTVFPHDPWNQRGYADLEDYEGWIKWVEEQKRRDR
jgi:hypothetical protein